MKQDTNAGPSSMAFDERHLFVIDQADSCLYRVEGGGKEQKLACYDQSPGGAGFSGLAINKKGHLFISQQQPGAVFEVSKEDGHIVRSVVTGVEGASSLAASPISDDLFVSHADGAISRISALDSDHPILSAEASLDEPAEGIAFAKDGTMYAASDSAVYKMRFAARPPNKPRKARKIVLGLRHAKGIAVTRKGKSLIVNQRNGRLTKIDLAKRATFPILTAGGYASEFSGSCVIIGFDDCIYANRGGKIVRLMRKDGTCGEENYDPEERKFKRFQKFKEQKRKVKLFKKKKKLAKLKKKNVERKKEIQAKKELVVTEAATRLQVIKQERARQKKFEKAIEKQIEVKKLQDKVDTAKRIELKKQRVKLQIKRLKQIKKIKSIKKAIRKEKETVIKKLAAIKKTLEKKQKAVHEQGEKQRVGAIAIMKLQKVQEKKKVAVAKRKKIEKAKKKEKAEAKKAKLEMIKQEAKKEITVQAQKVQAKIEQKKQAAVVQKAKAAKAEVKKAIRKVKRQRKQKEMTRKKADLHARGFHLSMCWSVYQEPEFTKPILHKWNGVCMFSGVVRRVRGCHASEWPLIMWVGKECMPKGGRVALTVVKNHVSSPLEASMWPNITGRFSEAKIEVFPDGRVYYMGNGAPQGTLPEDDPEWISLNGISYPSELGDDLQLVDGWRSWSNEFRNATATVLNKGAACMLSGLIAGGTGLNRAAVPEECRPEDGVVFFSANSAEGITRLDVQKTGMLMRQGGYQYPNEMPVSLDGVFYSPFEGTEIQLDNGWGRYAYGPHFRTPQFVRVGPICLLSGVIAQHSTSEWRPHIATLPAACRPRRRLIFGTNNHMNNARVDVLPSGEVRYVIGRNPGWNFLQLSGLHFVVDPDFDTTMVKYRRR